MYSAKHTQGQTRQLIFEFIQARIQASGQAPTHREISDALFYAGGTVRYHLHKLQDEGRLRIEYYRARGVHLVTA